MSRRQVAVRRVGWVGLVLVAVLPLAAIAVQAFATRWFFPDVVPAEWTLDAVTRVLSDSTTRRAVVDSVVLGMIVTAVSLGLAIPAARALVLGRVVHARAASIMFLVPTALPPVALAMGLNVMFLRTGLAGSWTAVVLAHLVATVPYAVLIMAAALTRYDLGYERQAGVLGAGAGHILVHVFLPLARPAVLVTAALTFIVSWGQYLLTLLPGAGRLTTVPVLLLAAAGGGNPTAAAALALVAAVPPALAVLGVLRHLEGLGAPGTVTR